MRDARLERLALERDRAVALLREWVHYKMRLPEITARTHEFLESLQ